MEYKLITKDRFEDVVHHLREFYFMDEPLSKAVRLCKRGEGHSEYENYIKKVLSDNMSIMAVNENDEIIGVRVNGILTDRDYVDQFDNNLEFCADEKYKKVEYFLNELNRKAKLFDRFKVDKILNFYMIAVDGRFRGKGLGKEMILRSEQFARDHGFKLIKAEATGIFSQQVLKSSGFTVLEEQYYDKWCDEFGKPILEVESPHISCQLLYKVLE